MTEWGNATRGRMAAPDLKLSRNATAETFYGTDLSHVHHVGFTGVAIGAAPAVLQALRAAEIHGGLVVELGCGSGVLAAALVSAGYRVLGVDRSRAMLDLARVTAPDAELALASFYDFPLPPCAAVLAVGEGLGYIGERDPADALPDLFDGVYQALTPGGLFIFDLVLRSARKPLNYAATRTGSDWEVSVQVTEVPERSILIRRITTMIGEEGDQRRSTETHQVRTFSRVQVESSLRAVGFSVRVRRSYGSTRLASVRLAFFARNPALRLKGSRG